MKKLSLDLSDPCVHSDWKQKYKTKCKLARFPTLKHLVGDENILRLNENFD